ncbi:hypothetical protein [Cellulomonas sp. KRMCY2]|uniref:hypothetical protein n=1 Tax=Cellulomonas sp. KRMCY2 TaxID=1304865 RepID=UPI00045E616F|nr:hypothetical protein [Cellulomonas sp. KRMCY2]
MSISEISGTTSPYASAQLRLSAGSAGSAASAGPMVARASVSSESESVPAYIVAAAAALGLSTDEVVAALASGMTLADLAARQDVSGGGQVTSATPDGAVPTEEGRVVDVTV